MLYTLTFFGNNFNHLKANKKFILILSFI
jgi:hypothetical protein